MTPAIRSMLGLSSSSPVRKAVVAKSSRSIWQMLTCGLAGYKERLPDFLCLGAQKSGTTTLHELLSGHPGVYLPSCKEVQYFTLESNQDTRWYSAHFQRANTNQSCGEITPYYLFHPAAPLRIHTLLPDAKLIILLRDPVERALSAELARIALMELVPAAAEGKFAEFAAAVGRYGQLAGVPFASHTAGLPQTESTRQLLELLAELGFCGSAQSSWGPAVMACCATAQAAEQLVETFQSRGLSGRHDLWITQFDNRGAILRTLE